MKIKQALFTAGYSSFYFDDQQAIKNGAGHDGFFYTGEPVTQGFNAVRQAGECVVGTVDSGKRRGRRR